MKRGHSELSSVDLFLDTICNTFGGIVFLAILLALMIHTRSAKQSPEESPREHPSPDEVRELLARLDDLSAEHANLMSTLDQTFDNKTPPKNDGDRLLRERLDRLAEKKGDMTRRIAEVSRELAEKQKENSDLNDKNENKRRVLDGLQVQVREQRARVLRAMEARMSTLRLPKVSSSTRSSFLVLVKEGTVYVASGDTAARDDAPITHVTIRERGPRTYEISPITGSGWPIDSEEGQREIRQLIVDASVRRNILTLAVWPDSYDRFSFLKDLLVENNVPYQILFNDTPSLNIHSAPSVASVQ